MVVVDSPFTVVAYLDCILDLVIILDFVVVVYIILDFDNYFDSLLGLG
jgi:hypothetical protein